MLQICTDKLYFKTYKQAKREYDKRRAQGESVDISVQGGNHVRIYEDLPEEECPIYKALANAI